MDSNALIIATADQKLATLNVIYPTLSGLAQELRQTVERVTMTGCGLVLIVTGWLIGRQPKPVSRDRLLISAAILVFVCIAVAVTRTLHARYRGVATAINNINRVQLAHTPGAFLPDQPLYPEQWRHYGASSWREPIFHVAYGSWVAVAAFSIGALWML